MEIGITLYFASIQVTDILTEMMSNITLYPLKPNFIYFIFADLYLNFYFIHFTFSDILNPPLITVPDMGVMMLC